MKGSERTARCDLARRTNQVNFQSHDTGKRRRKRKKSLLRSFTGNYFVVITSIFHSQIMTYVANITNREKNKINTILIYNLNTQPDCFFLWALHFSI